MRYAVVTLFAASLVATAATQVREVRVMSAGATAPAYLQLVPAFESKTKQKAVTLATLTGLGAQSMQGDLRFADVLGQNLRASVQVGDCASDSQHFIVSSG